MGKKTGGFQALGLDAQLLKGVLGMYSQPTPVQRALGGLLQALGSQG